MSRHMDRREFLKLAGIGGAVFASGLGFRDSGSLANPTGIRAQEDFFFVQLSDTHWGFEGPAVNPDAKGTLKKAVAAVNSLEYPPDFIVFTGDLTHTTDDPKERRERMAQFRDIISALRARDIRFLPGEHDASLDSGEAYREFFGTTNYTFDHKGVHFIVLDNVSDPTGSVGKAQIEWLRSDLSQLDQDSRIVVLTHRPLFALYPQWDWSTRDGAAVIEVLMPFRNVAVFYGHIHQEHHHMTGHIPHHAAKSLMFPLPPAGSVPKRAPRPWDPGHPYRGLGFRSVQAKADKAELLIQERPIVGGET
jgi:hypothetical protein